MTYTPPTPILWEVSFRDILSDKTEKITVLASIALEASNKAQNTNVARKLYRKGFSMVSIKEKRN